MRVSVLHHSDHHVCTSDPIACTAIPNSVGNTAHQVSEGSKLDYQACYGTYLRTCYGTFSARGASSEPDYHTNNKIISLSEWSMEFLGFSMKNSRISHEVFSNFNWKIPGFSYEEFSNFHWKIPGFHMKNFSNFNWKIPGFPMKNFSLKYTRMSYEVSGLFIVRKMSWFQLILRIPRIFLGKFWDLL